MEDNNSHDLDISDEARDTMAGFDVLMDRFKKCYTELKLALLMYISWFIQKAP